MRTDWPARIDAASSRLVPAPVYFNHPAQDPGTPHPMGVYVSFIANYFMWHKVFGNFSLAEQAVITQVRLRYPVKIIPTCIWLKREEN